MNFIGIQSAEVEKISWQNDTVWINKSRTAGFSPITQPVWSFHIGGYQVCEKWLKDRRGRVLSKAERKHYLYLVAALSGTICAVKEIEKQIERHGGWPAAFRRDLRP